MDLVKIFDLLSKKMILEWETTQESIKHSGEKGRALEENFRTFLRKYLPKKLDIATGFIIDSSGKQSKQLDVIIHDAFQTPLLYDNNNVQVIPIECVYAVIEVKSDIEKIATVCNIFENMKSVKDLEKKSYVSVEGGKISALSYGKEWDIWQVHYFVFALDSMDLVSISNELIKKNQEENRDVSKRVDCICVMKNGVMMNKSSDGMYGALPTPNSVQVVSKTTKPLLFFYRMISNILFQTQMPFFQFTEYTKDVRY